MNYGKVIISAASKDSWNALSNTITSSHNKAGTSSTTPGFNPFPTSNIHLLLTYRLTLEILRNPPRTIIIHQTGCMIIKTPKHDCYGKTNYLYGPPPIYYPCVLSSSFPSNVPKPFSNRKCTLSSHCT